MPMEWIDKLINKENRLRIDKFILLSHTSLYFKLLIILFLVFAVTIIAIAYQLEKDIESKHISLVKDELRSIASITAVAVNGDIIEQFNNPEQQASVEYNSVKEFLTQVMKANRNIQNVYIMRKGITSTELIFIIDADPIEPAEFGEVYNAEIAPDMLNGFIGPSVDSDFVTDKWGATISGYAPVRNSHSEVVAIIGIDFDANSIKEGIYHQRLHLIFYASISLLIMLMINLILAKSVVSRIEQVQVAVDNILEEDYGLQLNYKGKDEIQILASRVNNLIARVTRKKEQLLISVITALINALEVKDEYTHGHSAEVAVITTDILTELKMDAAQQFTINFAALLHDIGKIGIADTILKKTGKLTDEEFNVIKQHSTIGAKILEGTPSLQQIKDIVKHHHERYDGKGYPDGLAGQDISFGARVIAVADTFQAMISDRPYRKGMSQAAAIQELERHKGTQFDPEIVDVFLRICKNRDYHKREDTFVPE